jgi:hypothetical protein
MAWMWWLLAPMGSTALGALVLWLRTLALAQPGRWRRVGAIGEHHRLLDALGPTTSAAEPSNVLLVAAPAAAGAQSEPVTELGASAS